MDIIFQPLITLVSNLLWVISKGLCKLLDLAYDTFKVFVGVKTVSFTNDKGVTSSDFLFNIFFNNSAINKIYYLMMGLGLVFLGAFILAAVIKKVFSLEDKDHENGTYTKILWNGLRAVIFIGCTTFIVSASTSLVSMTMEIIDNYFDRVMVEDDSTYIEFSDEDYAVMFRVLDTVANYSMNDPYNTRVNVNSCFNEVRGDLQLLDSKGTFEFTYDDPAQTNNAITWQYLLRKIAVSSDIYTELPIDSVNDEAFVAISTVMEILRNNPDIKPLSSYGYVTQFESGDQNLGRTVMLAGTFDAALNGNYNRHPALNDSLRRPFYLGVYDIYDGDTCDEFFETDFTDWNYVVTIIFAFFLLKEMAAIIINCGARIFNIILLFLVSPPFLASWPLDEGGKAKQWGIAYMIQAIGILGTLIAVRLLMLFVPIILSPELVIFPNSSFSDIVAKLMLIVSAAVAAQKSNSLITGILADQAGFQSMLAGDAGAGMRGRIDRFAGKAMGVTANITGLGTLKDTLTGNGAMRQHGGLIGAGRHAYKEAQKEKAANNRNNNNNNNNSGSSGPSGGGSPVKPSVSRSAATGQNRANTAKVSAPKAGAPKSSASASRPEAPKQSESKPASAENKNPESQSKK